MSITGAELVTRVTADTSGHDAKVRASGQAVTKLGVDGEAAGGRLSRAFMGMSQGAGGLMSSFGAVVPVAGAVALGLGAVVGVLGAAAKAAMDEQVNIVAMTSALQANVPGWNGQTTAIEKTVDARQKLAFSDDALRSSLAELVRHTHDITQAFDLQSISMDLARAKNMSLVDASTLVGKVSDGNTSILKRYGIEVEKGATATQALAAIQQTFAGSAEAYSTTAAGGIDKMKNAFDNAMETVGSAVLPTIADLATKFSEMLPKIMDIVGGVMNFLKPAFELIGTLLNAIGTAVDWLGQKLGLWTETTKTATTGASQAWHEHETFVAGAAQNIANSGTTASQGYGANMVGGVNAAVPSLQDAVGGIVDTMDVQDQAGDLGFKVGAVYAMGGPGGLVPGIDAYQVATSQAAYNLIMSADQTAAAGALGAQMGQTLANNFIERANTALANYRATHLDPEAQIPPFNWPGNQTMPDPRLIPGLTFIPPPPDFSGENKPPPGFQGQFKSQQQVYQDTVDRIDKANAAALAAAQRAVPSGGRGGGGGGGGGTGAGVPSVSEVSPIDNVNKIAGMVSTATDALSKLADFKGVSDEALNNFFSALDGVITRMNDRLSSWWGRWGSVQADVAKGVGDAVAGVLAAVGPLRSLADGFRPISDETLDNFFAALDGMISRMTGRMELWWGRWGTEQAAVAKGAGDAVVGILGALAPLRDLANGFRPVSTQIMDDFFAALDGMLDRMGARMSLWWGRWGVEQANVAKGAGDAVTGVLGALAPLQKLADGFKPISSATMDDFFAALDDMIERLQGRITVWWGRWGVEQANIAKGAGDAVAGVLSALEPLMKLTDFKRPSLESIDIFFGALDDFLTAFDRKAASFGEKAGVVAAELAARVGVIMGGIGAAIDPIMKLADFKPIDKSTIESFMSSVWEALNQMKVVVDGFPAGFLDQAAGWGAKLTTAFGGIKSALDVIASLGGVGSESDLGGPLGSILSSLQNLMGYVNDSVLSTIDAFVGKAGDWNTAVYGMATSTEQAVQRILDALARLPGGTAPPGTPPLPPIIPPEWHGPLHAPGLPGRPGGYGATHVTNNNPIFIGGQEIVDANLHRLLTRVRTHKDRRNHGTRAVGGFVR